MKAQSDLKKLYSYFPESSSWIKYFVPERKNFWILLAILLFVDYNLHKKAVDNIYIDRQKLETQLPVLARSE